MSGTGDITVVVRDALGRETVQILPFYAASTLLKAGLSSYSVEAGALRENFGIESNDYSDAMGSGTLRHGFSDWLTGELHGEASGHVLMGGLGATVGLGSLGVFSAAAAVSQASDDIGSQLALGFEHRGADFNVGASTILASGDYRDVAAGAWGQRPPSLTRLNLGLPLGQAGSLSLAYTMVDPDEGEDMRIASLSYSVPVHRGVVLGAVAEVVGI